MDRPRPIMIVDHNRDIRELLAAALEAAGDRFTATS